MGGYIVRRLLATLVVMAIVGLIVFLLIHLAPGSPAAILAGDNVTPAQIDQINHQLGLDQPLPVQFGIWAWNILRGQFGDTGRAPGRPEVQQHIAALECIQRMAAARAVDKRHRRGGFGGFFQRQHGQRRRRLQPLMDRKQPFPI